MKKLTVAAILFIAGFTLQAQDLKQAKKLYDKKDLQGARTQIDGYVTANPDKAEGLYWKGRIYEAIAADDQLRNTVQGDAAAIAFEALKQAIEKKDGSYELQLMASDPVKSNFYTPVFGLFSDFFRIGALALNSAASEAQPDQQKAGYEKALRAFQSAEAVRNYLTTIKVAEAINVDTLVVYNIGQAAAALGKDATAVKYFKRLIDADVKGQGMEYPYEWVTDYYFKNKDDENFLKYQAKGAKNLPSDNYFNLILIDYYNAKKDYVNEFKGYEDLLAKNPDSTSYRVLYASDIFNYIYKAEGGKVDKKDEYLKNIYTQLSEALKKRPTDLKANWLMAEYNYNMGVENKTQSKDYFTKAMANLEIAIPQLEKGYRKEDKSTYKSMVNLAITINEQFKQTDKVKYYQQKYDDADKKFVNQ